MTHISRVLPIALLLLLGACHDATAPKCIQVGDTVAVVRMWKDDIETRHYILAEKSTCP